MCVLRTLAGSALSFAVIDVDFLAITSVVNR